MRKAYAVAYAQGTADVMREAFADDFTWRQRAEWPGRPVYTADELPKLKEELNEYFPEFDLEPMEYSETGDYVIVQVRISARLSAGDERVAKIIWHVWQLADGVLQNAQVFTERSDALAATGS